MASQRWESFPRSREEEEVDSDWGGSEAEDPRSFRIQDTLDPSLESVDVAMESRCKSSFEEMFPHGQELIHLVPSGDPNPSRSLLMSQNDTPPPLVSPEIIPVIEPLSNLLLPEGYSLVHRWNFMNHPNEPDLTALKNRYLRSRVGVDPEGREACASSSIYLEERNLSVSRKDSQLLKDLGEKQNPLKPFLVRWKGDDIATCDIHEIPDAVHVSRLFTVPKDKLNVRPIFDLSELNSFVVPLKT